MKAFKKFSSAKKLADLKGVPIYKCGELYIVPDSDNGSTEFAVLRRSESGSYGYIGNVTARHLERLGNANWAEKGTPEKSPLLHPKQPAIAAG